MIARRRPSPALSRKRGRGVVDCINVNAACYKTYDVADKKASVIRVSNRNQYNATGEALQFSSNKCSRRKFPQLGFRNRSDNLITPIAHFIGRNGAPNIDCFIEQIHINLGAGLDNA